QASLGRSGAGPARLEREADRPVLHPRRWHRSGSEDHPRFQHPALRPRRVPGHRHVLALPAAAGRPSLTARRRHRNLFLQPASRRGCRGTEVNEPDRIRDVLETAETVAVVGCSPEPARASYTIARYLLSQGYRVVPVNPNYEELLGQRCYPSLSDIPAEIRVDIVDVFRRSEHVAGIAGEAIARGVPFVFLQKGVIDSEAARRRGGAG